jgi:LysR family hydrogen peroxide-inducible transcriptional activator
MNEVGGRLAVGAIPTVMPYWLAPKITSFQSRYPDVEVHLVENITARLIEGLQTGDLDLAIVSLPISFPDIVCSELLREELLFVLPNEHPFAAQPRLDPRQIAGEHPLVLQEGRCFRKQALGVCRRGLREPGPVFESYQFSSVFALVAGGFGITVAPKMAPREASGCRHVSIAGEPTRCIGSPRSGAPVFRMRKERSSTG